MSSAFRVFAGAALGLVALAAPVLPAADTEPDALPPEPATGEWVEDTLTDDSLWFASSENLAFEAIARDLADYSTGRRWVRVVDGKPAWVMYYVPGEILGFEIDTHHFGAAGTDFRFAAGANWTSLRPVDVSFEEIVAFEAKWLRLYRSADELPPGTQFLMITFPADAEVDAARLTEVWLRCRFDADENPAEVTPAAPLPARANDPGGPDAAAAPAPEQSETWVEPLVVTTFIYQHDAPPRPEFPSVEVAAAPIPVILELPATLDVFDVIGELAALLSPPTPEPAEAEMPKPLLSRIVDFVRERVLR